MLTTARLVESKHVEVDHTVVPPDYKITAQASRSRSVITVVPPDYKITAQASRSRSVIPGCSRVLIADRRLDCRPSCADRSATARLVESKHVEVDHTVVPPDYTLDARSCYPVTYARCHYMSKPARCALVLPRHLCAVPLHVQARSMRTLDAHT